MNVVVSKKSAGLIALAIALLALALFSFMQFPKGLESSEPGLGGANAEQPNSTAGGIAAGQAGGPAGQAQTAFKYSRSALPNGTFAQLPRMPADFSEKLAGVKSGKTSWKEFASLGEEYWKQPEAYPNFEEYAVYKMLHPPENRWGAQGYGAFPSVVTVQAKPGDSFETAVFFKTSWLVESFQGARPKYELSSDVQDAQAVEKLLLVSFDPEEFLLEPAYPAFWNNWVRRITVRVKIDAATPDGQYGIGIKTAPPSKSAEWKKTLSPYFDATSGGDKSFATIRLTVKR